MCIFIIKIILIFFFNKKLGGAIYMYIYYQDYLNFSFNKKLGGAMAPLPPLPPSVFMLRIFLI